MADADLSQAVGVDLDSDDVVTVETLNDEISNLIDDQTDLNHDYVVGDVSGCRDSNGHVHFDLVFEDASIHCVLFGFCGVGPLLSQKQRCRSRFEASCLSTSHRAPARSS